MPSALSSEQVAANLAKLSGWALSGKEIRKSYSFKDFYETMAFVNAVAYLANKADHHPDLEVGYNKCVVRYSTHSAGGLTDLDFESATKVEAL